MFSSLLRAKCRSVDGSGEHVGRSFSGRLSSLTDWPAANMKVITSIYLNCRPDLRDEWLTGTEVEDVTDALVKSLVFPCSGHR